jgi:hypothetical protein
MDQRMGPRVTLEGLASRGIINFDLGESAWLWMVTSHWVPGSIYLLSSILPPCLLAGPQPAIYLPTYTASS